jgi:hypothetical protein
LFLITFTIIINCKNNQQAEIVNPESVAAEIIPNEGDSTSYGIPLLMKNTQQFLDYYSTIQLTPQQDSIRISALEPLPAPCCDDNPMSTCCCPCVLARSVWGLSKYLITEKKYNAEELREAALQWLKFIRRDYFVLRGLEERGVDPAVFGLVYEASCYTGKCNYSFSEGGCGGMVEWIQ